MTTEQYITARLGELELALAATMAERDSLKAQVAELKTELEKAAIKAKK